MRNLLRGWLGVVLITLVVAGLIAGCLIGGAVALWQGIGNLEWLQGGSLYTGTWELQLPEQTTSLIMDIFNGSIRVQVLPVEQAMVTANWQATREDWVIAPAVDQLDGEARIMIGRSGGQPRQVDVEIIVPPHVDLILTTGNGQVEVNGDGQGELRIATGNGRIVIEDWLGEISAVAGNGLIAARLSQLSSGTVHLRTGNGRVRFEIHPDSAFSLTATAGNGRISVDLPDQWQPEPAGGNYQGTYNGGGAEISLSTGNGDIYVLFRQQD